MNRKYTAEEFKESVKLLRENFENVILTADVIVGFPGETEEEFEETYKFLEVIRFYKIHVFKYSKREGTKAAGMANQIAPEIKEERSKKVIELSNRIQKEYNRSYIGKTVQVLVEEKSEKGFIGHTENYLQVEIINAKQTLENQIINVKIEKCENDKLLGRC